MTMNSEERERERIRRLRDSQVTARDPGPSKIRHYDWSKHRKPVPKSEPFLIETYHLLPGRGRSAVIGVGIGLVFGILLRLLLPAHLALLAIVPVIICGVVGWVLGKTLE
jgi:hypothetical protein